jgi:hypothetical protein
MKIERKKMRGGRYIVVLLVAMTLVGCGAQRRAAKTYVPEPEAEGPTWHTCLIQGARVTVTTQDNQISANATMQVVRDSMLVISIMPMLGIEMMRIEATPDEIIGIDKLHAQYARAGFDDINRKLTPSLSWEELQQLCSAELPLGSERARLIYTYGDEVIDLSISYPTRLTDIPVRVGHLPLNRYTQIDITKWL